MLLLALSPSLGFASSTHRVTDSQAALDLVTGAAAHQHDGRNHDAGDHHGHAKCMDCTAPCGTGIAALPGGVADYRPPHAAGVAPVIETGSTATQRIADTRACRGPPIPV